MTMDKKQIRKLWRLGLFENLKVALPIIAVGLAMLASLVYAIQIGTGPTKLATCIYQYSVISPNKWQAGTAIAVCKLPNGGLASIQKPAGWIPPDIGAEMDVLVPK